MTYINIFENFTDSRIQQFWVPVIYDAQNAYVILDPDNYVNLYCNESSGDSAFLKSLFPVASDYLLWIKFRIDAANDDADLFTIYNPLNIIVPKPYADLQDTMKIEIWWDNTNSYFQIAYYNTSNVYTALDVSNPGTKDDWYWIRILKTATKYCIDIYNSRFINLTSTSIALSNVYDGINADYFCCGVAANDDHQLDLDVDYLSLKFDYIKNNYSNFKYFANNLIRG